MTRAAADRPTDLVILAPVFNDWPAVRLLLPRLDTELAKNRLRARVVLVNDGSYVPPPASLVDAELSAISQLRVLSLRRNLGHQRALDRPGVRACADAMRRGCRDGCGWRG